MADTYKIVRFYRDGPINKRTIMRGLTEEEAKAHCKDPRTSSRTAPKSASKTQASAWFDGFTKE